MSNEWGVGSREWGERERWEAWGDGEDRGDNLLPET